MANLIFLHKLPPNADANPLAVAKEVVVNADHIVSVEESQNNDGTYVYIQNHPHIRVIEPAQRIYELVHGRFVELTRGVYQDAATIPDAIEGMDLAELAVEHSIEIVEETTPSADAEAEAKLEGTEPVRRGRKPNRS